MENTPKNFALQLGSLITLYISITALITLLINIITVQYPDVAQGYYEYESAVSGIRFGIALLVVFFPAYIVLTRAVNTFRRVELGAYLGLTRWLIYLSLIVGGATLLGDLVAVVDSFLNGELTVRFVLKALVVLMVVGAAFAYYLLDARGYWQSHEKNSVSYCVVTAIIVLVALVLGYTRIEAPTVAREMKIDVQQVTDLTMIQSTIQNYYAQHNSLPKSLSEAYVQGITVPAAPQGRDAYTYTLTAPDSFKICAQFKYQTSKSDQLMYSQMQGQTTPEGFTKSPDNWTHGSGNWCFDRSVTPKIQIREG